MKKLNIFLCYYLPSLVCLGLIYYFSSIPDLKSDLPGTWDLIMRKIAHTVEYALLAVLIFRMFYQSAEKEIKALSDAKKQKMLYYEIIASAFILCVLYAFSDEFHQTFVAGRSGSFKDAGIDTVGIIAGMCVYIRWKFHKK